MERGSTGIDHELAIECGAALQLQRSRQLIEQRLCLLQIGGSEPVGRVLKVDGQRANRVLLQDDHLPKIVRHRQ